MAKKKPSRKSIQRAPRTSVNMRRANAMLDPPANDRIRKQSTRPKTRANKRCSSNATKYRQYLSPNDLNIHYAISTASQRWRATVRDQKLPRKDRKGLSFRPDNYEELLRLIPEFYRSKPDTRGNRCIYVLPKPKPMTAWLHGVVEAVRRHKEGNWIIVRKPPGSKRMYEDSNPYHAIHSTNVFLEPPVNTSILCKRGLYVLYCPELDEYYVGESSNIPDRIRDHERGRGAIKTRRWHQLGYTMMRVAPLTVKKKGTLQEWERIEVAAQRKLGRKVAGGGSSQS